MVFKLLRRHDTGWCDVSANLLSGATGTLHVRREGLTVWWRLRGFTAGTAHAFYWPPAGMAAPSNPICYPPQETGTSSPFYLDNVGRICRERTAPALAGGRWWGGSYLLPAGTPPLAGLPGEEVA